VLFLFLKAVNTQPGKKYFRRKMSYHRLLLSHWDSFIGHAKGAKVRTVGVDGHNLDLAAVIAVARCRETISPRQVSR
jgi:hypothetical protein